MTPFDTDPDDRADTDDPDALQQMYQEVILDAARDPHGKYHFAADTAAEHDHSVDTTITASHEACTAGQSHQFNPTCGDEATVRVEVSDATDGDKPRIEQLIWDGHGCSISQASLSVMVDLVQGRTVEEALRLAGIFHRLMESRGAGLGDDADEEAIGDGVVFQGVSRYPMRIKCALLGWEGMKASIAKALQQQHHDGQIRPVQRRQSQPHTVKESR